MSPKDSAYMNCVEMPSFLILGLTLVDYSLE